MLRERHARPCLREKLSQAGNARRSQHIVLDQRMSCRWRSPHCEPRIGDCKRAINAGTIRLSPTDRHRRRRVSPAHPSGCIGITSASSGAAFRSVVSVLRPKAMFSPKTRLASKRHLIWLLATALDVARLLGRRQPAPRAGSQASCIVKASRRVPCESDG
jgi:hypothetical protein